MIEFASVSPQDAEVAEVTQSKAEATALLSARKAFGIPLLPTAIGEAGTAALLADEVVALRTERARDVRATTVDSELDGAQFSTLLAARDYRRVGRWEQH